MAPSIHVSLLGGLSLTCHRTDVVVPMVAQRLLAFLALSERPLRRTFVAGTLWPDVRDQRARASLRSAIWRLGRCTEDLIETTPPQLRLGRNVAVDLHAATQVAHGIFDRTGNPTPSTALELLSEDILPDWYDEWILVPRERFRQLRLHALESLCEQLVAARRFPLAVEAGTLAVAGDQLRESAHRTLIRAYIAEGNVGEAVRQYELYKRLMWIELGVDPSPELERVVSAMIVPSSGGRGG